MNGGRQPDAGPRSGSRWGPGRMRALRGLRPTPGAGDAAASAPADAAPPALGPGWEQVMPFSLRRRLSLESPLGDGPYSPLLLSPDLRIEDLLFFDTETTGLSGGAGTLAFLVGMAWVENERLHVEQLFLEDFPGEPEFLEAVAERLGAHRLLVSYNGRAFDAHILRNRFLLNRRSLQLEAQLDLLYWARRLWRRTLGDCSLSNIEREVLGVHRQQDVAGFEVPGIYLEYLSTGQAGRLPLVMEHNLQDVVSLVRLFDILGGLLADSAVGGELRADTTALGRLLLERGYARGEQLLQAAFTLGKDELAARLLSLHYKRRGQWEQAAELWQAMLSRGSSLFAAVETAKYLEHRRRRPAEALEWVLRALSWDPGREPCARRDLLRRRERLERKAAARAANS